MFVRNLAISALAGLTLLGATAEPPQSQDIRNFSILNLQNSATLDISYSSAGCFHYETGVLRFSADTVTYQDETKPISILQARQIDNYFRVLDTQRDSPGYCTTQQSITLTLSRNGEPVLQDVLVDGDCLDWSRGFDDTILPENTLLSPTSLKYKLFEDDGQQTLILDE